MKRIVTICPSFCFYNVTNQINHCTTKIRRKKVVTFYVFMNRSNIMKLAVLKVTLTFLFICKQTSNTPVFCDKMSHTRKIKVKMTHFENQFEDYTPESYQKLVANGQPSKQSKISLALDKKWRDTVQKFESLDYSDYSVYTGTSGVALLYFKKAPDDPENLQQIKQLLSLSRLKKRRHTFLCGDTGALAIGAVVAHKLGQISESQALIKKILHMKGEALDPKSDLPSEYLYGRAGYLFSLLFLNKYIQPTPVDDKIIREIIEAIFTIGKTGAARGKFKCPLMYQWHDSYYLGAAHGLAGILYLLLVLKEHLTEQELKTLVKPTVDYLATLRFPSGNYPSSLGSDSDGKVQWCHGAPGFVFLFSEAYKVFKEEKYLKLALEAGEVVWQRGLVRKGYSICHGVSGNAYCFLELYQTTKEPKHLYRAIKFAEWCVDDTREHEEHYPDRPLSLFEGIAGRMYLLLDIQKPMEARFPGFSI